MYKMKNFPSLLATMLVTVFLCVACGEKSVVDAVEKMYDDGIARVQKAEGINDVQQIYDEVTKQVKNFKNEHLKEFASLDSTANSVQEAEETFIKACCIKLKGMNSTLETEEGLISVDENGNFNDSLELAGDEGNENQNNPLNIIGYTHICNPGRIPKHFLTVQTSNGDCLYNEEDAEQYYDYYISQFFFAEKIGCRVFVFNNGVKESTIEYVKKNLFDILNHLPLDSSYPNDVVECVNKVYYDNKEEAATLHLVKRDYGKTVYGYYKDNDMYNLHQFHLLRHDEGKLIIWIW